MRRGFTKAEARALASPGRTGRRPGVRDRYRGRCLRIDDLGALKLAQRGNNIRAVRDEAGIGAGELAAACGVGKDCVVRWENGASFPYWRLFQIAHALGVPVDHLVRST